MPGRKRATKYSFRCVCSNGLVETARLTVAGIFPIFNVMLHSSPRDCEGETVLAFEAQARAQLLAHFSLLFRRELLNCLDNFLPSCSSVTNCGLSCGFFSINPFARSPI